MWCCYLSYCWGLGREHSCLRMVLPGSLSPPYLAQQKGLSCIFRSLPPSSSALQEEICSSGAVSFLPQLGAFAAPFLNERRAWERTPLFSYCQNHNKWQVSVCHLGAEALVAGQAIHFSSIKGH